MATRRGWAALLCGALLFLGCVPDGGGGEGGGGDGGPPPNPPGNPPGNPPTPQEVEALAADLAEFYCEFIRECAPLEDDLLIAALFEDAGGDCEAFYRRQFGALGADLLGDEAELDEAAWRRCRSAALDACVLFDGLAGCRDLVRGERGEGAPCPDDTFCRPGLHCAFDPQAAAECTDVCTARLPPGSPCFDDGECADAGGGVGFCDYDEDADTGACATLVAGSAARVGEPCGRIATGDGFMQVGCAEGGYCPSDDRAAVCTALAAAGEPCEGLGVPCEGGVCVGGVCTAIEVLDAPGAACNAQQWRVCNPFADLQCIDGVCVRTAGEAGDPCSDVVFGGCGAGLYCDAGTCRPQLAPGEACDLEGDYDACGDGYCEYDADRDTGVCLRDEVDDVCR